MQIIITEGPKTYFVYRNAIEAEEGFHRLRHLKPHICSKNGGKLNAVVVDIRYVTEQGEG